MTRNLPVIRLDAILCRLPPPIPFPPGSESLTVPKDLFGREPSLFPFLSFLSVSSCKGKEESYVQNVIFSKQHPD